MQNESRWINSVGMVLFGLLCLASIVGERLYFIITPLQLIRLLPIFVFLFTLFLPHTQYDKTYYIANGFFFIYTAYTIGISIFYWEHVSLISVLNYVLAFVITWSATTLIYSDTRRYLRLFYWLCVVFILLLSAGGFFEAATGKHFVISSFFLEFGEATKVPNSFFVHSNNYATVLTLMLLYVLAYRKNLDERPRKLIVEFLLIATVISIILLAKCRLALLVLALFLLVYWRKIYLPLWRKHKFFLLTVFVSAVCIVCYLFYESDYDFIRLNLYKYALLSLPDSYFLGFGAKMEQFYYNSLNNFSLFDNIVNTHSFLFEMLITSGVIMVTLYLWLLYYIEKETIKVSKNEFCLLPICYLLLLFGPSSSVCLWIHYIFFAIYVGYIHNANLRQCNLKRPLNDEK